jgi:hypothetical protein
MFIIPDRSLAVVATLLLALSFGAWGSFFAGRDAAPPAGQRQAAGGPGPAAERMAHAQRGRVAGAGRSLSAQE